MKNYKWIWLLLIAGVLAFGTATVWGGKDERGMNHEITIEREMRSLDRLLRNYYRVIEEYDRSNDDAADTLLWSMEKTRAESERIFQQLLSQRSVLRVLPSQTLARQQQVERWSFRIDRKKSLYDNVIGVLGQFVNRDQFFADLLKSELEIALDSEYFAEAYGMVQMMSLDRQAMVDLLPRFKESAEGDMMALLILGRECLETLAPIEDRLSEEKATDVDRQWEATVAPLSKRGRALLQKLEGTPYESEAERVYNRFLGNRNVVIRPEVLDTATGEAEVTLFGIFDRETALTRDKKVIGQLPEGIVRATFTDRLPDVGSYTYRVDNLQSFLEYARIMVYSYRVPDNKTVVEIVDRATGMPVPDVRLKVIDNYRKLREVVKTDNEGKALFASEERAYEVWIEGQGLPTRRSIYIPELPHATKPKDGTAIYFYTDRPLYRRGQEVKVGVVTTRTAGGKTTTDPEQEVTLAFIASRAAEIVTLQNQVVTTNENGVAEISFTIPEDQELDNYRIASGLRMHSINVEDYKRSYLSISIDRIPNGYVKGHPLVIEGRTTDLNGLPTPAKVQLTYQDDQRVEVTSDSDGRFVITTPVIEDDDYGLTVDASDALGNTASEDIWLETLSTDMPLNANALIAGNETVINKEAFALTTATQPYTDRLLGDLSDRRLYVDLVSKNDTVALGEVPAAGSKSYALPKLKSGEYKLLIKTVDGYGQEQRDISRRSYYFYSPEDKTLSGDQLLWGTLAPDGRLLYGSSYDLQFRLTIYHDGTTVHRQSLKADAGQIRSLELPDMPMDIIHIEAVRHMDEKELEFQLERATEVEKTRVEGLDFPGSYLPGDSVRQTLRVIGKEGRPLVGAPVIVSVYDQAVQDAATADYEPTYWRKLTEPVFDELMCYEGDFAPLRSQRMAGAMLNKSEVMEDVEMSGALPSPDFGSIKSRSDFAETAYFSARLLTDEQGEVQLDFKLPDSETKYITKVYAFTPDLTDQVMEETTLQVKSPLSIDVSLPRYLTKGDTLNGEVQLRNSSDRALTAQYQVTGNDVVLAEGAAAVAANSTVTVPFAVVADLGDRITLQAKVVAGKVSDGIERVIPLRSDESTYVVAVPFSVYQGDEVQLDLPKAELADSDLSLQIYLDPIQLLLGKLAITHQEAIKDASLNFFSTVYVYSVYSRLHQYLSEHPDIARHLRESAPELEAIESDTATYMDRMADAKSLGDFYSFITDSAKVEQWLSEMEIRLLSHYVTDGGFRYSNQYIEASPWLTHFVLELLSGVTVRNEALQKALRRSLPYLERQLTVKDNFYREYVGYALLAHNYQHPLSDLGGKMSRAVEEMRKSYPDSSNRKMLEFAEYSRLYDSPEAFREVRQFVEDRSHYTVTDEEKLQLMLFLSKTDRQIAPEVVERALRLKQNTLWYDRAIVDITALILERIEPTVVPSDARLTIDNRVHQLSPVEKLTGAVSLRYPSDRGQVSISWHGIDSDYTFGGLSYTVRQKSVDVTATGEKLTVRKEIYVRKVDAQGNQTFVRANDVQKGDRLIVRYYIEAAQDLSLIFIQDPRPATSEFGYDFRGFRFGDRVRYEYSRRDDHDRIYIDYLPRGRHQIELEAVATQSGDYTYGPAQIRSYYAPEYAGNSAGGRIQVR
ncbi:MAG: alpha-2-macroglobulin family protein [Porphyromonas sp.]|nr:alpha-2-macroglobulin family protein [Porphyromonas sp.]